MWHGVLVTPVAQLTLLFNVREDTAGILTGDMESIDQGPGKAPLARIVASAGRLAFAIPGAGATFEGVWNDSSQSWTGTFRQSAEFPLVLKRGAPPSAKVVDGVNGVWRATVQRGTVGLRLVLRVRTTPYGTRVSLDSPDMMAMGLQVEQLERAGDSVRFRVPMGGVQFAGTLTERPHAIAGEWVREGQPAAPVTFVRDTAGAPRRVRTQWPITPKGYHAEEVSFANPTDQRVTLAGTLTVPDGAGPFPAVVLISGSGPQDRDETIFGHKPFAVLADYLTRRGIAVLRYDDRGFAKSTGGFASATSADFATDANAAVRYLKTRKEINPRAIGLAGHSEGGLIAPIAAVDNDGIAFVVLLAGPGTRTEQVLISQSRLIGMSQGVAESEIDRMEPILRVVLRAVGSATDSADAVARVRAEMTTERLAILGITAAQSEPMVNQWTSAWMRYFLAFDPANYLSRLRVPVLAINGSLDVQVASAENLAGMRVALAQNPDATVRELPGLNHFFQTAKTGAIGEYDGIAETFAPSALAVVGDWIVERFGMEGTALRKR
jgi:pimeloyl-ACP methyl ester carboxylesterase